jgi:hypothetical protein
VWASEGQFSGALKVPQLSSCAASFPISGPGWKETDADLRGLLPEFLPSDERETHLARAIFLASVLSLVVKSCYPFQGLRTFKDCIVKA